MRSDEPESDSVLCADELCWIQGRAEARSSRVSIEEQTAVPEAKGISLRCWVSGLAMAIPLWILIVIAIRSLVRL